MRSPRRTRSTEEALGARPDPDDPDRLVIDVRFPTGQPTPVRLRVEPREGGASALLVCAAFVALSVGDSALAQGAAAQLSGTIVDTTGASLPDVTVTVEGDCARLTMADDGAGLAADWQQRSKSLGLKLVELMARQIGGEVEIAPRTEGGTRVVVSWPLHEMAGA